MAEYVFEQGPWLADPNVKSLNLPAFIASEIARQIVLEMKWNITGKAGSAGHGSARQGLAGFGRQGKAWLGKSWRGLARLGVYNNQKPKEEERNEKENGN